MRIYKVFVVILTGLIVSGCGFYSEKHNVEFLFGKNEMKVFVPPNNTYKCRLKLINSCSPNDTIKIFSNDVLQINDVFITKEAGIIMDHDWYKGQMGIKYKPGIENNRMLDECKVTLELIFFKI